jgi:hypothetical protein
MDAHSGVCNLDLFGEAFDLSFLRDASEEAMSHAKREQSGKAERRPLDQAGAESPAALQFKRQIAGLRPAKQVQALRPSAPLGLAPVQLEGGSGEADNVKRAAAAGVSGSSGKLPHLDKIQQSFGGHDVSGIKAYVGGAAEQATQAMGATAYATGDSVAFKASPDLHTAAHEAAHVVQQRAGVSLPSGVGRRGDAYEKHADAVADQVASGRSAEGLLSQMTGETVQRKAVQRAGGGGLNIKTEARKNPVAKKKVTDVENETAPKCASLKAPFFAAAERRLNADPSAASDGGAAALKAMRDEVAAKEDTYLLQGPELPTSELINSNGVTRILDLPSLYDYNYLKPSIKALYPDTDAFVKAAQRGRFDPDEHLDNRRSLRGKVRETWWGETGKTAGMNLEQMIKAFHLVGDEDYEKGAVELRVTANDVDEFDLKLHKPTAFDGLQQGWGTDPWWVASNDPNWGLTKHNTKEVVMGAARLRCFSNRRLVLPSGSGGGRGRTP